MKEEQQQEENNVAIALNNIAISLLERNFYHEALLTFRSACKLISKIASSRLKNLNDEKEDDTMTRENLYKPLHVASLCLARLSCPHSSKTMHTSNLHLTTLIGGNNKDTFESAVFSAIGGENAYVIRMDPNDDINLNDMDLTYLTILYNYGVAQRCYHLSHTDDVTTKGHKSKSTRGTRKYLRESKHTFIGLYRVLSKRICRNEESDACDDYVDDDGCTISFVMLLSMLTLQNLITISSTFGQHSNARAFYCTLGDLREVFCNDIIPYTGEFQEHHCSAAA